MWQAYAALQARPGSPLAPIAKLVVVAGAICIEKPMRENPRGFVDDAVAAEVEKLIARGPNFDNEPIKARILKESDLGKRHPTAEELSRISVPTLLLWGDKDEHIPLDCAERAAKIIPGARLVVLRNVGHIPSVEVPHDFVRIVSEFAG